MEPITDEFMGEMLAKAKPYSVVLLKATPKRQEPEADAIVWEQGRGNLSLEPVEFAPSSVR